MHLSFTGEVMLKGDFNRTADESLNKSLGARTSTRKPAAFGRDSRELVQADTYKGVF